MKRYDGAPYPSKSLSENIKKFEFVQADAIVRSDASTNRWRTRASAWIFIYSQTDSVERKRMAGTEPRRTVQ